MAHRDPARRRKARGQPNQGYGYLHTAIDDHFRLICTEILDNEQRETAAAFPTRARGGRAPAGGRRRSGRCPRPRGPAGRG
jgi:hypothetical protein